MLNTLTDSVDSNVSEAETLAQLRATQIVLADAERQLQSARDKLSAHEDLKRIVSAALDLPRQLHDRLETQAAALKAAEARATQAELALQQIQESAFWRLSKPMRNFLTRHSGLRHALRRVLAAVHKIIR